MIFPNSKVTGPFLRTDKIVMEKMPMGWGVGVGGSLEDTAGSGIGRNRDV